MLRDNLRMRPGVETTPGRYSRILGHPVAYLLTTAVLLTIFGWTFIADAGRPAPADDPAYYAWRTEALIGLPPSALLEIDGPMDMYSGGYRVTTPVIAAFFRQLGGVDVLTPTVLLAVGLRTLVPLLLAGFAFRHRRDPLLWHSVALGSASLLLTPPFGGYLDNVLTLLFITASLYFLEATRTSWAARAAVAVLLVLSGLTHPTTLAIFCIVVGAMAVVRLIYRRGALRSVIRDDGPFLATAFASAIGTYLIWKVGIWGEPASLADAALPPPASPDFFKTRLSDWVAALRPVLNGPLFLLGAIGLVIAGRRAAEDDLARVAIVWLAPLVGIFGFLAGVAYPYYRFFNTTLAWVLLIGVGIYIAARFFISVASKGGVNLAAALGLVGLVAIIATNFGSGLAGSHWNDSSDAWLKPDERTELETVASLLESEAGADTQVVFVVDSDADEPVRIYGAAKLAGNVTRYAVPGELQDQTSFYLGSVEDYLMGQPSDDSGGYRAELSEASLVDTRAISEGSSTSDRIVVVPSTFNETGANEAVFSGAAVPTTEEAQVWVVQGAEIETYGPGSTEPDSFGLSDDVRGSGPARIFIVLVVLGLMLIPGIGLFRYLLPRDGWASALGMIPALSLAALAISGITVLAVTRSPFSPQIAWGCLAAVGAVAFAGGLRSRRAERSQTA